jgi:hypothetical protein
MPLAYPYVYSNNGTGPWWGIQLAESTYLDIIRQMHQITRCFVHVTNLRGDNIVVAVEGPHNEANDIVFMPDWLLSRLGLDTGSEIRIEAIIDPLPRGETVKLRPMTVASVENPIFIEGLTEALNQLGVIQDGLISVVVDPSMPALHEFMVENLMPASVCLADGELRVDLEPAVDFEETRRQPSPLERPDTPIPLDDMPMIPTVEPSMPSLPVPQRRGFVPFSGTGHRLG